MDEQGRTYLFEARNPEIAELLIKHGVDVNARDKNGDTALLEICPWAEKPAETVRVLLKHGADPNVQDKYGMTPLMRARDGATVDALIEYGADIKVKSKDGLGLLQIANADGDGDGTLIEALIRHGAPFDKKTDGPTMLMRAAWRGKLDMMAYLLNQSVDPNLQGLWNKQYNDYMTPLTAAVTDGQYDAVKLLIDRGATVQGPKFNGKPGTNNMNNALQIGARRWLSFSGSTEIAASLNWSTPSARSSRWTISRSYWTQARRWILRRTRVCGLLRWPGNWDNWMSSSCWSTGAPKSPTRQYSPRPGCWEGQDEVVAYLLQKGAKPTHQVMWNAIWNCHPYEDQLGKEHFEKTIQLLIDAGGLKGLSPDQSFDLLEASIFTRYPSGNTAVVKMLLDSGLSLETKSKNGKSIMDFVHEACKDQTCQTPTKEMMAFLDQAQKDKAK